MVTGLFPLEGDPRGKRGSNVIYGLLRELFGWHPAAHRRRANAPPKKKGGPFTRMVASSFQDARLKGARKHHGGALAGDGLVGP